MQIYCYFGFCFQIESGENWANPSILTLQLDGIICTKFPELGTLFHFEINSVFRCQTNKVVEAVEELRVNYNLSRELAHIITPDDMQSYNKVFCFLLKVKWGITTLEKLQFARSHKRRIPYAKFEMIDLIMRRLEQLRFWMMYAIQSVHFHLMTHVLHSMGEQLNTKIDKCVNLKEMEMVHKSYLSTVCEHCFLTESVGTIKTGIEQLLSLVSILRDEWRSCVKYIESNSPLAISLDDSGDEYEDAEFVTNSQIDAMEFTYICCHQYLANALNDQVYLQKNKFRKYFLAENLLEIYIHVVLSSYSIGLKGRLQYQSASLKMELMMPATVLIELLIQEYTQTDTYTYACLIIQICYIK